MHISDDKFLMRLVVTALFTTTFAAGCGSSEDSSKEAAEPAEGEVSQSSIGACTRNQLELRNPVATLCAVDSACPCGSFCDPVDHTCKFQCNVPPQSPAESCGSGQQCDDTGRCVTNGYTPPAKAVLLTAVPPLLQVAPSGGAAVQLAVKLSLLDASGADLTRALTTRVSAVADENYLVSCDASTFAATCDLASWTFAWDGTKHNASRTLWVRSAAGNADESGNVRLVIEEINEETSVVTMPAIPTALDGTYTGTASSPSIANGVPVTVRVRGNMLLVRDPSQIVAPDGALLIDYLSSPGQIGTWRRLPWLRPVGAAPTAGALVGEVRANNLSVFNATTGALTSGFTIALPNAPADNWSLQLQRTGDHADECTTSTQCAAGSECVAALGACVPTSVWTPLADPVGNNFEDPRSLTWWNAISPMLGTGDVQPPAGATAKIAFATTGADLIESLMCATTESDPSGRIGVVQLKQGLNPSKSGDLNCVAGGGGGSPNLSPGAVGLASYRDREVSNDTSLALLGTCLSELARPVSGSWANNFTYTVGKCVNLARFLPALRLLSTTTNELDKRTQPGGPRLRGLMARLVQQWTQLQGFLASTGLSDREYDDAVAASLTEARAELMTLLDNLDAGWAALLDKRVAAAVANAAPWAPTDANPANDYREAKKPLAYWTFNNGNIYDHVRSVPMNLIGSSSNNNCKIVAGRNTIFGDWNCPGFLATLPATGPQVGPGDMTVSMFTHDKSVEFPPYSGGTMFMTETMAGVAMPIRTNGQPTVAFVHPTSDGGTEWVAFDWTYGFYSSSFAIVRDSVNMTYTLYLRMALGSPATMIQQTQRYYRTVGGRLNVSPRNVRLYSGQFPHTASYPGVIDDFAIWDSALSKREFYRFADARGLATPPTGETGRFSWPTDMNLVAYETQEIKTGVGASMLEAQVAHLNVVNRLAEHLKYEAPAACSGTDVNARANLDAAIARAGRTIRQSLVIEGLARLDTTDRAVKARTELRAKRSAVTRALHKLTSCADPYGLDENEVPLYFGDIVGETAAFFAASDHMLSLANSRATGAKNALDSLRASWDAARQSKIQEQMTAENRAIRIGEMETRFGDQLKRLCGITERTTQQVIQEVKDGTFNVDTCYVAPTQACQDQHATATIMTADPACYRGIIGAQIMDMRAAYHSQQASYEQWQAALGNADGAERQCVLKEMDLYGCSALDRHRLVGVTCPPNYQGTVELVAAYNEAMTKAETEKSWLSTITSAVALVGAVAATAATGGAGLAVLAAAGGTLALAGPSMDQSIEQRKRSHTAMLQKRAAEADIRDCWTQAEQFQRAIAAAEETSKEAVARMQTAVILQQNALAEAREILLEAPIAIDREQNRPTLPIAFHYWLPDEMFDYRFKLDRARRYTYLAMRAAEYDLQKTFNNPPTQVDHPSRAAVLGSWRPATLLQQLDLLGDETDARKSGNAKPSEDHLVVNIGRDLFGLDPLDPEFGLHLQANARPVYSKRGEYLGEGVRFSFLPKDTAAAPLWRCAERVWRANVGRAGALTGSLRVKLFKRTVFASRGCAESGPLLQVSSLRPEKNLLTGGGEPNPYEEQPNHTVADIDTVDLNILNNMELFQNNDDFVNGSSTELAGQGMFGDYVLLFPGPTMTPTLLEGMSEMYLRFDYLSVDNTPVIDALKKAAAEGELKLSPSRAPIIVD
jgi:hypothetical protein